MKLPNFVAFDDGRMLTRNYAPGQRVYDEELHTVQGEEFRTWNPSKSKLGAYLVKGGQQFPLRERANVLYLGAANGTTPSHVSDIVRDGVVVAVEFSPRSFRDLLHVAQPRENLEPVLADAWRPELYERFLGKVDFLFQDIAQRQQATIFAKNIMRFKPAWALIAVKARSVNVAGIPRQIYEEVATEVSESTGYQVVDMIELGPFEKDHAAIVFRPASEAGGAPPRQARREERRPPPRGDRGPGGPGGPRKERRFEKRPPNARGGGGGGPPPGKPDQRRKWR